MSTAMRHVLLANGEVAVRHLDRAVRAGRTPELLVLNAVGKQRRADELRRLAAEGGIPVVEWGSAAEADLIGLARAAPDLWLLSIYFGHVVPRALLDSCQGRAVNLHPSLLPWNRGTSTNVWPIIDGSPAGVTLHAMVDALDAGPILVQREVPVHASDTAGSLYERLVDTADALLAECWPDQVLARWPGTVQNEGGSSHTLADFRALAGIDLTEPGEARRFFDLLRARSFPGYPGLRIRVGDEVVEARVELSRADGEE